MLEKQLMAPLEFITKEDLEQFKKELFAELRRTEPDLASAIGLDPVSLV